MQPWLMAHWADIVITLTLVWYGLDGWRRGFLSIILDSIGFLIALLIATLTYRSFGGLAAGAFPVPPSFGNAIAFFGIWWLIDLVWPLFAGEVESRLPAKWRVAKIGRVFGVIPGLANGALILSVMLTVVSAFPLPTSFKQGTVEATLSRPLLAISKEFDRLFAPLIDPVAGNGVNMLTTEPSGEGSVDLHFTVHDAKVDEDAERKMLDLINAERVQRGEQALVSDELLVSQARAHGRDMFARGYFSHVDPEGRSPADRLDLAGIPYGTMGENLALAPEVTIAHSGLMASPGHRANILGAGFRRVGIGVIDGGVYGEMFVQEFTD